MIIVVDASQGWTLEETEGRCTTDTPQWQSVLCIVGASERYSF